MTVSTTGTAPETMTGATAEAAGAAASQHGIIGRPVARIDGPLKTTGTAEYAGDFHLPWMAFAVPVQATVGKGTIRSLDVTAAEAVPGVLAVLHRGNMERLYRAVPNDPNATVSETRPAFEDDRIYYWGQYVALVVAESLEQATAAAAVVKAEYAAETPEVSRELEPFAGKWNTVSTRGTVDAAFAAAAVKVDQTYGTPAETHNPIELHATVAVWDGDRVTFYESTQGVVNHRNAMAQILGVPRENVTVVTKFLGSGFGGKLFPWPHCALAAVASRKLQRPVKLVVTRTMMFSNVGHRPVTEQRFRIGASADGKLVALRQDALNHTSLVDSFDEGCGEATGYLYSVPNLTVASALVGRNVGSPMAMRGPGAVPGLFAMESAMDELAVALKMDPVELRLKNDATVDESNGRKFSSRHLRECLETGSAKFGWKQRTPQVGSMRRDGKVLGWGMAAASWGAYRFACATTVDLNADGKARVRCATQDVGTGLYTIFAQVLAEKTGLPFERIEVLLGDSSMPEGPLSGGSWSTATVLPAVAEAADGAIASLLSIAASTPGTPLAGADAKTLRMTEGRVHRATESAGLPSAGVPFEAVLQAARLNGVSADGRSGSVFEDPKARDLSMHSFGAQFAEVEWEPEIARLRVSRVVTVIDAGRIINPRAGANQIRGAVVMGVGMALLEETVYDRRNGQPINGNLADYLMATSADAPEIDVTFLDYPDFALNSYGARGIGEIGLAGVAPAIASAVYHATGVRVRKLPIRIEDLMQA